MDYRAGPALSDVIKAQAERCKTLVEMAEKSRYFFEDFEQFDEKAAKKNLKPAARPVLEAIYAEMSSLAVWEAEPLHAIILQTAEAQALKLGKVAQPLRVAVTGNTISPPLDITLQLIGRERVLNRMKKAIDSCNLDP
jgi:glutamyl-tRNA synthetase